MSDRLAGLQLSHTQPIRVGDVMVVEADTGEHLLAFRQRLDGGGYLPRERLERPAAEDARTAHGSSGGGR